VSVVPFSPLINETQRLEVEAEQALENSTVGSPDHETARMLVMELRSLYAALVDAKTDTDTRIRSTLRVMEDARALLAELRGERASSDTEARDIGGSGSPT
jgi:hypothetical protein